MGYKSHRLVPSDIVIFRRRTGVFAQSKESLPGLMKFLDGFGRLSGLKVNWSKSCIYPLHHTPSHLRTHQPIQELGWEYHSFKYLGVQVYHTEQDLIEGNIQRVLRSMRGSLWFWSSLPLSPIGRVSLCKMLILPRFLYYFSALPVLLLGFSVPRKLFNVINCMMGN